MTKPAVTVLTDPVPGGREVFTEGARRLARRIRYSFSDRSYASHPYYRGHVAVTRSLVRGLERIGASFNYNPTSLGEVSATVIVLAGIRTLRQAIRLKRQGSINRLLAGPNIVTFSSDCDSILTAPDVDEAIAPSDWVVALYLEDNDSLRGRIFSWPAGVDTDYWAPLSKEGRDHILIFNKQCAVTAGSVESYADYLGSLGWTVDIIHYGTFRHTQYREMLHRSCLMLGFAMSESQGIAWAEAWAADVPTLLWRNTSNVLRGRRYHCSTAPYLCEQNGLFFDDFEDFKRQFVYWKSHRSQFAPRAWTLANMSDEVCAALLYQKATQC